MNRTKSFFAMFRLHLKGMLAGMGLAGGDRKKKASSGMIFILLIALYAYIGISYGWMLQSMLYPVGGGELGASIILVLALILSLLTSVSTSQGIIFGCKDSDFLFSLPVSEFSILISKLTALYVETLATFAAMLIPSCVIYQIFDGFSLSFSLLYAAAVLLVPLLCCTVSVVFGFIVALLRSLFPGSRAFSLIVNFASLGVLMYAIIGMQAKITVYVESPAQSLEALYGAFIPAKLFGRFVFGANPLDGLLLFILCLAPYLAVVWILSKFYRRIITALSVTRTQNKKYNLSDIKQQSVSATLLKREIGRFFGTTILALNAGFGCVILLIAPVALFFFRKKIPEFLGLTPFGASAELLIFVVASIALVMCSTCYTAAVSVSLEGSSLWLIKSMPVKTLSVLQAKINANFIIGATPLVWCTAACGILFKSPVVTVLLLIAYECICFYLCCCLGLIINLFLPKLDALNDVSIVKQSASAMAAMLSGMILMILSGVLTYFLSAFTGVNLAIVVIAFIYLLSAVALQLFIRKKGVAMFYALI